MTPNCPVINTLVPSGFLAMQKNVKREEDALCVLICLPGGDNAAKSGTAAASSRIREDRSANTVQFCHF
jgi:hypothetical protein